MNEEHALVDALRHRDWEVRSVATHEHARRMMREDGVKLDLLVIRQPKNEAELRILLAEIRRDHPGLPIALALTTSKAADLSPSLTTQIDLLLPSDIRDRDAADSLAKLLRLP
jgi:DNA-binding NtrC family response regulator